MESCCTFHLHFPHNHHGSSSCQMFGSHSYFLFCELLLHYFFTYLWFLMWRDSIYSPSQENHRLHDHRLHHLQYCELHSWGIYNIAPTWTTRICARELPFLCFMQCTHIFFTQFSVGGECESPIRQLKQGPQALADELMLTLSRGPPAPPDPERPKHALEGGRAHHFST